MRVGGISEAAYHPDVGLYLTCDHCGWGYGFAPAWRAWIVGMWHWWMC